MWHLKAYKATLEKLAALKAEQSKESTSPSEAPTVQAPSPINYSFVENFEAIDKVEEEPGSAPANYI